MAPVCFLEMTDGCACIVLYFLSGRLCYHCADKLQSCPGLGCSRRKNKGKKLTLCGPGSYVEWAPQAEEPPEAAWVVQGLLSARKQEHGDRLCAVSLAGAVQNMRPQDKGGCEPSAPRGSRLSRGLPRLLTHFQSGTGCSG